MALFSATSHGRGAPLIPQKHEHDHLLASSDKGLCLPLRTSKLDHLAIYPPSSFQSTPVGFQATINCPVSNIPLSQSTNKASREHPLNGYLFETLDKDKLCIYPSVWPGKAGFKSAYIYLKPAIWQVNYEPRRLTVGWD